MILVTGGTGRYGDQVVRTLRKLGLEVRALVRKGSHYYWLNDTGCGFFFADLLDPVSLRRACRDVSHLVVCSGIQEESRTNNHSTVTVEGHAALFQAARERGVSKVVMLSCLGVESIEGVRTFEARRAAEEHLVRSGLEYTILRAPLHEHFFLDLAWAVHDKGRAILPAEGNNRLQPIASRDVALLAAASLDLDAVRNQVVSLAGPQELSARRAFELACEAVGVQPTAQVLPGPALALGRRLGRPVRRYSHKLDERAAWFEKDLLADAAAVERLFSVRLTPFEQALQQTNEIYRVMRDPEEREKRMVHPQFYATVYEPGEDKLENMPLGPIARD